jgi:hypothetical protein
LAAAAHDGAANDGAAAAAITASASSKVRVIRSPGDYRQPATTLLQMEFSINLLTDMTNSPASRPGRRIAYA